MIILTEVNITKLMLHPTGKVRNCLKCDEKVNNTDHTISSCNIYLELKKWPDNISDME